MSEQPSLQGLYARRALHKEQPHEGPLDALYVLAEYAEAVRPLLKSWLARRDDAECLNQCDLVIRRISTALDEARLDADQFREWLAERDRLDAAIAQAEHRARTT